MNNIRSIFRQPTCPWWFLFTFDNPIRKFYQDPIKILSSYVKEGMTVADLGCGMGYFSIPLARLVGEEGQVVAIDLQSHMLDGLKRRAEKDVLLERIKLHQCSQDLIGYPGPVDFVLAFWMVHEVHDQENFLDQIWNMLGDKGHFLIVEPYIHVSRNAFQKTVEEVKLAGFSVIKDPSIGFSRSILAQKEC